MASYNYATISIVAICFCLFHLSSSQDAVINGKQDCSKDIHNPANDDRRVLKGGGASGGHAVSGRGAFSGGASSSSHGYSSEAGRYSSSSKIPTGILAAGAVGAGATAASASSHSNHQLKSNGSPICTRTDLLLVSLLSICLSSFVILSRLLRG